MAVKEKNNNKRNEELSPVQLDIVILIILAVSVLLFISAIGFCGILGVGLRFLMFGIMGMPAFAFPVILFFAGVYILVNKEKKQLKRQIIGLCGLFILICALCQIIMTGYDPSYSVIRCFIDSAYDHLGGGFIGGCIVQLLGMLIGVVGTYIVLIIGMVIFAIVITQKPLASMMKSETKEVYRKAKESRTQAIERKRIKEELARAQKEAERNNRETERNNAEKNIRLDPEAVQEKRDDIFDSYLNGKFNKDKDIIPDYDNVEITDDIISGIDDKTEDSIIKADVPIEKEEPSAIDVFNSDFFADIDPVEENEENNGMTMQAEDIIARELAADEGDEAGEAEASSEKDENKTEDPKKDQNGFVVRPSKKTAAESSYRFPPLSLLKKGASGNQREQTVQVKETARKLQQTLNNFGVEATVVNVSCGPTVTRYEIQPDKGVKVSRIVSLADDIKLNLAAADIRIEAPIPGKAAVGIEVPNKTNSAVALRDLLDSAEFKNSRSKLSFAVGKDLAGRPVISDIAKMPHLLIAGSTGSGKSVCINTLIMSILYKARPDEVKLIMVDPKVVELSIYNGIPHLLSPVVTDPKKAAGALQWAVTEMTRRYNLFAEFGVRDIEGYNHKAAELADYANEEETKPEILPQIVIIVDELADLMMAAPGEVEEAICRLAQLARAAGLHLIIATQRPSVNVITGLIKANMPSRIALSVTSGIDSRVIIDMNGAEKLLGRGDMLFHPAGYPKPARVQGCFVSDDEIQKVVDFISKKETVYDETIQEAFAAASVSVNQSQDTSSGDRDVYFTDAGKFIIEKDKASIGMLQRVFKIGFNRAARIMDQLCDAGVVGPEEGTKPRKILMTMEQFENFLEEN